MPYRVDGNPTGAGDALVAGLALGLVERTPWPERLRWRPRWAPPRSRRPVAGDSTATSTSDIDRRSVDVDESSKEVAMPLAPIGDIVRDATRAGSARST